MTDTSPEAVAKLLEGVTSGPWMFSEFCRVKNSDGTEHVSCKLKHQRGVYGSFRPADARFIAASRDLVPAQSARIAELGAEVARLREGATHLVPAVAELLKALDAYGAMDGLFAEIFPDAERRGTKAGPGYKAVMAARANVQAWSAVTAAVLQEKPHEAGEQEPK